MFGLGPEGETSLKRVVEAGEEDGYDSDGEGTGSTELSDIRLLGRCRGEKIFSATVKSQFGLNKRAGALTSEDGWTQSSSFSRRSSSAPASPLGEAWWLLGATGRWYCVVPVGMCQK